MGGQARPKQRAEFRHAWLLQSNKRTKRQSNFKSTRMASPRSSTLRMFYVPNMLPISMGFPDKPLLKSRHVLFSSSTQSFLYPGNTVSEFKGTDAVLFIQTNGCSSRHKARSRQTKAYGRQRPTADKGAILGARAHDHGQISFGTRVSRVCLPLNSVDVLCALIGLRPGRRRTPGLTPRRPAFLCKRYDVWTLSGDLARTPTPTPVGIVSLVPSS